MGSGQDRRGSGFQRTVLEKDVHADREDRIWNGIGPRNILWPRHVWPGIDVPGSALVARHISPGCVGYDVAVLAQKRFDDVEQRTRGDCFLRKGRRVEHAMAKLTADV